MKYWPLSTMMNSPALSRIQKRELMRTAVQGVPLSYSTMIACHKLAMTLPACTSLVTLCSEDCARKLIYLKHPTMENWLQLERVGFIGTEDNFGFTKERMH